MDCVQCLSFHQTVCSLSEKHVKWLWTKSEQNGKGKGFPCQVCPILGGGMHLQFTAEEPVLSEDASVVMWLA